MKNNIVIAGIGLVAVAGLFYGGSTPEAVPAGVSTQEVVNELNNLGALTGPSISSSFLKWGSSFGVTVSPTERGLVQATTTICAIQSPVATSTLVSGALMLDVSSTTSSTITIAKSATAFVTTTLIRTEAVGANAQETILFASTTVSALEQTNRIFGPNEWLVVGMAGGTGTFSPVGSCQATFVEIRSH